MSVCLPSIEFCKAALDCTYFNVTGSFVQTYLKCPMNILTSLPGLSNDHMCAPFCLQTDFCTGFMYDSAEKTCHLVDQLLPETYCEERHTKNWVKRAQ
jgi:hypothetical protein